MSDKRPTLQASDHHLAGYLVPEVVEFGFLHPPEDEHAINGLKYIIRIGNNTFKLEVSEGKSPEAQDGKQISTCLASGEKFLSLVEDRHLLMEEVQAKVLDTVKLILSLINDIKVKKE